MQREERMIEKVTRIGQLFDLYGAMLTERQQEMIELYYFDNLSLAEIADELGVSRQAIHDNLRRAEEQLEGFEHALHLLETTQLQRASIHALLQVWETVKAHVPEPMQNQMQTALERVATEYRL